MDALVARVVRAAAREQLFRRTSTVLLALSGGADSSATLVVLRELRERFGFTLSAAHFDHQLRDGSRDDLEAVRALCARFEVPFLSGEGDVRGAAKRTGTSIEETARTMRYQFLAFVAAEKRIDAIATGHTADDQAETVLLRILRGTGVRGLRAMLPSGPVPGAPAQRLIRPLLPLTHAESEQVCAEAGIVPLVDASNSDTTYLRNRIRAEALPALRALNPSISRALLGLADSAREAFVETERRSFAAMPKERLPVGSVFTLATIRDLPTEALTLVVERESAFFKLEVAVNRTRLRNLRSVLQRGTGSVAFGRTVVEVSAGLVRIGGALEIEPIEPKPVNVPGATVAGPWSIRAVLDAPEPAPGERIATLELDAVTGVLRFRSVVSGDRLRYHGIDRNVADVLANARVPVWERQSSVVVVDRERVHALLTASQTFEADHATTSLWLRLAARPPTSQ
jgi:tRNA(Ile)-lysidine synthase